MPDLFIGDHVYIADHVRNRTPT